ncbi:MAG TPA: hypothetical protein VF795_01260 [Desulfuromonadaceae bacterium]
MENGTVWGHGAYLGPDFSAAYLHGAQHGDAGKDLSYPGWDAIKVSVPSAWSRRNA